ncbi:unnamed protein product [Polarella glacialis]|uniref:Uncharacterized protein n=1 Tax=Polarella glacialis TaxID=89957 RepID=A0A813DLU1_POLGL|nr:unnamed protein product [Polarella glacialis]
MVAVLQSEHVSCPCTGEANVPSEKNWSEPQLPLFAAMASTQAAEPTACESAFFRLTSEDSCGGEDGPSADKACSPTCKPLACQFVAACKPAGSNITFEDENGETQTIPADGVQDMVAVLQSEHVSCPCTGEANVPSEKNWSEPQLPLFAAMASTQAAEPTACESAFFRLTSEDSCGGEDGPSADKACSPTCKPLACQFVAACKPAGSNITFEDENGETQTIPADGVQDMVAVLQSEHVSCPCTGEANVPSEKNWSEPQLPLLRQWPARRQRSQQLAKVPSSD